MIRKNVFAIALAAATLLMATGAYAGGYPPGDDSQAPRGSEVQANRGSSQDVQAPRGQRAAAGERGISLRRLRG